MRTKCILGAVAALFLGACCSAYAAARYIRAKDAWAQAAARYSPRIDFPVNRARVTASIKRARIKVLTLRRQLIERTILPSVEVRKTSEGYQAIYYGFKIRGILTPGGARCLLIYFHGHNGSPFDYDYYISIAALAKSHHCDTLTFSPVGVGLNAGPASYPSAGFATRVSLSTSEAANHETYRYFKDRDHPSYTPLHLFLSGHYAIIRRAIASYDEVRMIGLSAGGWSTTMLAAMIPEIDRSVAWAGSFPQEYRLAAVDIGDLEQNGPFYDEFDYWTLYELGSLDKRGQKTRAADLVYNDKDDCCFADPAASSFQRDMSQFGTAKVLVVRSDTHSIDPPLAERLLFSEGVPRTVLPGQLHQAN